MSVGGFSEMSSRWLCLVGGGSVDAWSVGADLGELRHLGLKDMSLDRNVMIGPELV